MSLRLFGEDITVAGLQAVKRREEKNAKGDDDEDAMVFDENDNTGVGADEEDGVP